MSANAELAFLRALYLSQLPLSHRLAFMSTTASSPTDRSGVFAENRDKLWRVAYRMLGSRAEAEDIVQEAWLRWNDARGEIRSPKAWLITATTRLCIDRLRQLRADREG